MSFDAEKFVDGLHDYLERAFKPINERFKALEERIAVLEGKATLAALFGVDDEDPPSEQ